MSLQINLSSRDLTQAYQDVVNARGIDWAIFTYDKGSNDLKVQATGDGGLEELQDEFSDGRYASFTLLLWILCPTVSGVVCSTHSPASRTPMYVLCSLSSAFLCGLARMADAPFAARCRTDSTISSVLEKAAAQLDASAAAGEGVVANCN